LSAIARAALALGAGLVLTLPAFAGCSSDRTQPASRAGHHTAVSTSARIAAAQRIGIHPSPALGAQVTLPTTADGQVALDARAGDLVVRFGLRGAAAVSPREGSQASQEGVTLYPAALDGADVMHATLHDGVEDLVFFDEAPEHEELVYDVDVSHVAGLHTIAGALELLDARGVPRIRIDQPFLVDATGERVALELHVEGCAVDSDPGPAWDRPVVPIGARSCRVRVAWSGVRYPAIVDPAWRLATSFSGSRHSIATVTYADGKILALSGTKSCPGLCGNGVQTSVDLYDPALGAWAGLTSLPIGRADGAAALLPSGKALFVGGGGSSRVEVLGSNGSVFRSMDTLPAQPSFLTATLLANGKVLVAGGDNGAAIAQAVLYDEPTDSFSPAGMAPAGSLKVARSRHTATVLASGKVLLAGGTSAGGAPLASAEIYDPVANTFTLTAASMITARSSHIAALLPDKRVLLAGGGTATAEIYDPVAGTFTATGSTLGVRQGGRAVVLKSGNVMIVGGTDASVITGSVEIFGFATKTFVAQPLITFARDRFGAALLPSGDVLVFAGLLGTGYSTSISEIWHPAAAGTTCTAGDDCLSGSCEEGVCCAATCGGACKTCTPVSGACVAVLKMDDPNSCTATDTCDAVGACKKKNGQACASAAECGGAICVDGTCCDRACEGQCEACNVTDHKGTCSPVAGDPRNGRAACTAAGTLCGGTCNGLAGASCAYPSAVTLCASSCTGESFLGSTCDGRGACVADDARPCAGNFVCADAVTCKTSCVADPDCRQGYQCESGKCLPTALCEDHFVTKGTERVDCAPYTCEQSGRCRDSCASVAECVAPTLCSFDGFCVAPPAPPDSGCSVSAGDPGRFGARDTRGLVPLLIGGVLLMMRARARRRWS